MRQYEQPQTGHNMTKCQQCTAANRAGFEESMAKIQEPLYTLTTHPGST
jgi:hypothetical protein